MKHIILILSLFVISCTPKGGPEQMLRMKDGREITCRLLSVRANGLVVDTSQPPAYHITNAEIGMYPFESIDKFIYDPVSASKTIVLSATSGFAGGVAAGFIVGANEDGDVAMGPLYAFGLGIGGTVAGAIIGAVINDVVYHTYDPSNSDDREQIAKLAIYKNSEEPDKLKNIK